MLGEVPERNEGTEVEAVRVEAPARLHFGFLDLHGGLGRRFGSIGLAIDEPSLALTARRAVNSTVTGPEAERVRGYVEAAAAHLRHRGNAAVTVERVIPAHAGFGSGTQLALAVAAAMAASPESRSRRTPSRRPWIGVTGPASDCGHSRTAA